MKLSEFMCYLSKFLNDRGDLALESIEFDNCELVDLEASVRGDGISIYQIEEEV